MTYSTALTATRRFPSYLSAFTVVVGFSNAKNFKDALSANNENIQKFIVIKLQKVYLSFRYIDISIYNYMSDSA